MQESYCEFLRKALDFEKEGLKFYEEALSKVRNHFAREALKFLVNEEKDHIDKILKFNDYLLGRGDFNLDEECRSEARTNIKELVESTVKAGLKDLQNASTDVEIYRVAMEFEKRGYEFYRNSADEEEDERIKRFATFLVEEEIRHYNLLENTIRYLEDPSYYFEDLGGWIFS